MPRGKNANFKTPHIDFLRIFHNLLKTGRESDLPQKLRGRVGRGH